ncbi:MAG: DMT family transporter [bacterium]|nr:DMT family transporter [bacterium]
MTHVLALLGTVTISFSAIFFRLAEASPDTAAFFRNAYALPFLYGLWLLRRSRDRRAGSARWLAFLSGVVLAVDLAVWHRAIVLIGAGLATVLASTQVIFVGALAWLIHRERPTAVAFATVPVVFVGVALTSGLGRGDAFGTDPLTGAILGVLTGLAYATFLLIFRASNRQRVAPAGPLLDATLGAALGSLVLGTVDRGLDLTLVWPAHGWLLALALGSQVVGWLLITGALPRLPALETSVLLLMQPMFTMFWGVEIFAEFLSAVQWTGVVLVLAGVGWLSMRGSVREDVREDRAAGPR